MFGRVLTLQVRLEKKPEMDRIMNKEVLPLIQRAAGLLDVVVLQDEIELDKLLVLTLWNSREDLERYHVASYAKVKSVLEPFLIYPPSVRMFKVHENIAWQGTAGDQEPAAPAPAENGKAKFLPWHWQAS
jgi:heme-degrading monooxygenase HmoA